MTNANAVKHFVARGAVDLAASVSEAPSTPAAWWSVRPPAAFPALVAVGLGCPKAPGSCVTALLRAPALRVLGCLPVQRLLAAAV